MTEIELLLNNGADADTKDHKDFTLLMSYAMKNDIESVKTLLAHGASLSCKDLTGFSALDYAINENHQEMVEFLVNNGAIIKNNSYMLAMRKNLKHIVHYFDSLDSDKQIFLKKRR